MTLESRSKQTTQLTSSDGSGLGGASGVAETAGVGSLGEELGLRSSETSESWSE